MFLFEVVNLIWSLDLKTLAFEDPEFGLDFTPTKDDVGLKKPDFKAGLGNMDKLTGKKENTDSHTNASGDQAENNA